MIIELTDSQSSYAEALRMLGMEVRVEVSGSSPYREHVEFNYLTITGTLDFEAKKACECCGTMLPHRVLRSSARWIDGRYRGDGVSLTEKVRRVSAALDRERGRA